VQPSPARVRGEPSVGLERTPRCRRATSSARHAAARKLNRPLLTSYYFISVNAGAGHAWRTPAPVTRCGPDLFQAAPAADNSFSNLVIQLDIFMIVFLQIAMERGQQIPGIVVQLRCRNIPFPLFVVCSSISSPFVPTRLEPQRPPARRTRIVAHAPRQILAANLTRPAHFSIRA
jgi:hypothetical protein